MKPVFDFDHNFTDYLDCVGNINNFLIFRHKEENHGFNLKCEVAEEFNKITEKFRDAELLYVEVLNGMRGTDEARLYLSNGYYIVFYRSDGDIENCETSNEFGPKGKVFQQPYLRLHNLVFNEIFLEFFMVVINEDFKIHFSLPMPLRSFAYKFDCYVGRYAIKSFQYGSSHKKLAYLEEYKHFYK